MQLFDTHCHIADPAFDADRQEVIGRFLDAGVRRALVVADPCEETPNQEKVFDLVRQHDFLYAAIGVHPHNACRYGAQAEQTLQKYVQDPRCRLWGEIGLDYHYDLSPREDQRRVFDRQLDLAYERGLPVQLHIREAHGDCMDMLRARAAAGRMPGGIMHCYAQSAELVPFYLKLGLYLSFSGTVTFKNARGLLDAVRAVPLERILTETDSPYLTPEPFRGKTNQPAYVRYVAQKVAELKGVEVEALNDCVLKNFRTLCPRLDAALRND